jgi:hypothetical protein
MPKGRQLNTPEKPGKSPAGVSRALFKITLHA